MKIIFFKKSTKIQEDDSPSGVWGVGSFLGNAGLFVPIAETGGEKVPVAGEAGGGDHLPAVALSLALCPQDVQHGGQDCRQTHRQICSARLARQELQTV